MSVERTPQRQPSRRDGLGDRLEGLATDAFEWLARAAGWLAFAVVWVVIWGPSTWLAYQSGSIVKTALAGATLLLPVFAGVAALAYRRWTSDSRTAVPG